MKTRYKSLIVVLVLMVVPSMTFSADRKAANADASKPKPAATVVQQRVVAPEEQPNLAQASTPAVNPAAGEQIKWQVIAAGGAKGTSTNYVLSGTAGQTAAGPGASTSYRVNQGFQQSFAAPYKCGNANGDAIVDISDVVYIIAYIFSGGSAPSPLAAGDANCDSIVDISDAVYLIAYIFSGGAAPCAEC
jgi:hypothetical protein